MEIERERERDKVRIKNYDNVNNGSCNRSNNNKKKAVDSSIKLNFKIIFKTSICIS